MKKTIMSKHYFGNYQLTVLNQKHTFNFNKLTASDAFLIDADVSFTRSIIKSIRSHADPSIFLKPIFLLSPQKTGDPIIRNLNDGIVSTFDKLEELGPKINELSFRSTHLSAFSTCHRKEQLLKKSFDYMFTRNIETFTPYLDPLSSIGYTWPEISVYIEPREEPVVFEILEFAKYHGLVSSDYFDKIQVCNGCERGFIHYRKVCPTCNSTDIEPERSPAIVSVDDPALFQKSKLLKENEDHAPFLVHHCNCCNCNFQHPFIIAKCLYCKKEMQTLHLQTKKIYNYTFTKSGRSFATKHFDFSEKSENEGITLPVEVMENNLFVSYE